MNAMVVLLATGAGFINATASLYGRKAAQAAVPLPTLVLATGLGICLAAIPWWWRTGPDLLPGAWWAAPACGLLLFLGNIGAMAALIRGSVAVAVPVLSSKVVLVAVAGLLLGLRTGTGVVAGAVLAAAGVALVAGGRGVRADAWATAGWALGAALCYAGFDLLVASQGGGALFPAAACWSLIASAPLLAWARLPEGGRTALAWSSGLQGVQTALLVWAIVGAGDAALPNVLYGCRGIWSVLLVLAIGHRLGLADDGVGPRRLLGAAAIAAGILCALLWR